MFAKLRESAQFRDVIDEKLLYIKDQFQYQYKRDHLYNVFWSLEFDTMLFKNLINGKYLTILIIVLCNTHCFFTYEDNTFIKQLMSRCVCIIYCLITAHDIFSHRLFKTTITCTKVDERNELLLETRLLIWDI